MLICNQYVHSHFTYHTYCFPFLPAWAKAEVFHLDFFRRFAFQHFTGDWLHLGATTIWNEKKLYYLYD